MMRQLIAIKDDCAAAVRMPHKQRRLLARARDGAWLAAVLAYAELDVIRLGIPWADYLCRVGQHRCGDNESYQ